MYYLDERRLQTTEVHRTYFVVLMENVRRFCSNLLFQGFVFQFHIAVFPVFF
jgi:hypothetical protein